MTWVELRHKAAQSYMMALASDDDAEISRYYDEGDRYNDMADALIAREEVQELELV